MAAPKLSQPMNSTLYASRWKTSRYHLHWHLLSNPLPLLLSTLFHSFAPPNLPPPSLELALPPLLHPYAFYFLCLPLQLQLKKKEEEADLVAPYSRSFDRTLVTTILNSTSGGLSLVGRTVRVGGWVKTGREAGAGAFAFLEVNDGSCFDNLQVMVEREVAESSDGVASLKELVPTSTCVLVEGTLAETPEGTKQKVGVGVLTALCEIVV
jgi:hypothetical protein